MSEGTDKKKRKIAESADASSEQSAEAVAGKSNTVWDQAEFADEERKRKFMRLMGATKNPPQSSAATSQRGSSAIAATTASNEPNSEVRKFKLDPSKVNADLEREFMTGMSRQLSGNRRACVGFGDQHTESAPTRETAHQTGTIRFQSEKATRDVRNAQEQSEGNSAREDEGNRREKDEKEVDDDDEHETERESESKKYDKYSQFQFNYSNQQSRNNSYHNDRGRGRGNWRGPSQYHSEQTGRGAYSGAGATRGGYSAPASSNAYMQRSGRPGFGHQK